MTVPEIPFDADVQFEASAVTDDLPFVFVGPDYDSPPPEEN